MTPDHILQNICLKTWLGFIFGPYAHFLLMNFFSKNLKFFFDFFESTGSPLWIFKNRKKFSNFLKKNSLIKNVHVDQKWSHAKVLGKYFEVYGQACPITPEAAEKRLLFCWDASQLRYDQLCHNTEKTEKLPKVVGLTPYVSESMILSQFAGK